MFWGKDYLKLTHKKTVKDGIAYAVVKNTYNKQSFAVVSRILDLKAKEITVPEVIDGLFVLGVGEFSFSCCKELERVELPFCISAIGKEAFGGCTNLYHINVPEMLETIDKYAFSDCISLEDLQLPDSVKIAEKAFDCCPLEKQYKDKYVDRRNLYD